jgi:uncharacterized protein (TIGR02145 family)
LINFTILATQADAGADQTFNDRTTSTTLSANTPEPGHGTGQWSIVSGTGGTFDDINSPTAVFTGIFNETYCLRWTISTVCQSDEDYTFIVFCYDEPGEQINDIDGNSYNTVWINGKNWMAENLKTTRYNDGTALPLVTGGDEWDDLTTPAYCWYNNDSTTYAQTYGALYNWYTVHTGKLCPDGWHAPSNDEWSELTNYLGGVNIAGGKLKETGTTHWLSPNEGATNETGFTALPGGYRSSNGGFDYIGNLGYWWSATEYDSGSAWYRNMTSNFSHIYQNDGNKGYGFSVRCVRDD